MSTFWQVLPPSVTLDAEINPISNWAPARLSKRVHYWNGRLSIITGSRGNSFPILVMKSWISLHFGDRTNLNCNNSKLGSAVVPWLVLLPHSTAKVSFLWSLHVLLSLGGYLKCRHVLFPSCVVKNGSCSAFTVCGWLPGQSPGIKRSRRRRKSSLSRVGCTHLSCSTADQIVCMFYSPAVWYLIQHNFKLHAIWKSIF